MDQKDETQDTNRTRPLKAQSPACPVGAVMWYLGTDLPSGWLWCDGERVPMIYPKLREIVEWTPDLREAPQFRPHHIIRAE